MDFHSQVRSFKACAAGRTPDLSEKASCQARRSGHWSHLTKLPGRASLWTPLSPSVSLLSCVCCLLEQRSQESQCELLLTSCENVAMLKSQLLVSAELLTDSQGHMFLEEETGDGQGTQDVKSPGHLHRIKALCCQRSPILRYPFTEEHVLMPV
ncbi:hypothetical protein GHT09_020503 [Marmota monax]|uniref:Uncharacterized protein n=1 Tax=Marmota monax TaxID=9995 RepID=A0A834UIF3_MARMO|nr:hypothetical protein GHT09_020503 [Marmota monax]